MGKDHRTSWDKCLCLTRTNFLYPTCLSRDSVWSRSDPLGIVQDAQEEEEEEEEVVRMRRIRSAVAVATATAAIAAFAGPALADDKTGERLEDRLENRA